MLWPLQNLRKLTLVLIKIHRLEDSELFHMLVNLEILKLDCKNLVYLNTKSFDNLSNLKKLFVTFHSKILINAELFHALKNLEELSLSRTPFDPKSFHNLVNLKQLNISHSNIRKFHLAELFSHLSKLEEFSLCTCRINYLDIHSLKSLVNLKSLNLSDNDLTRLSDPKLFINLNNLEKLNLSQCKIYFLNPIIFEPLPNLIILDLGQNKLNNVNDLSLKSNKNLKLLNLKKNLDLTEHSNLFEGPKNLKILIGDDHDPRDEEINYDCGA